MPRYTVVGTISPDELTFRPVSVYPGDQRDKVPHGGWGHVLDARNESHAKLIAIETYLLYTSGALAYEIEVTVERAPRRGIRWPWRRRKTEPESLGRLPIV